MDLYNIISISVVVISAIIVIIIPISRENRKDNKIREKWMLGILSEVNNNSIQKKFVLLNLYKECAGLIEIKSIDIFKNFKNSFEMWINFMDSEADLKNKEIFIKYQDYIFGEKIQNPIIEGNIVNYLKLDTKIRKNSVYRKDLLRYINQTENQLINIEEIYNLIVKEIKMKFNRNEFEKNRSNMDISLQEKKNIEIFKFI